MRDPEYWRTPGVVTALARTAHAVDQLPADIGALRGVSQRLVFHYSADGDWTAHGIDPARIAEVDTRYAEAMLARIIDLASESLGGDRPPQARLVGCCRDFTVLYVAMARRKGLIARARVGYATYFAPGWFFDHVIAEVWDHGEGRWRLVEPEIPDGFSPADGPAFDPLDVPRDRFITGPDAWLLARDGRHDPERFVVVPDLEIPYTRSWLSLRHHLVQDLLSLNKAEMLLWDQWGILEEADPLDPRHLTLLDQLARSIAPPTCPGTDVRAWGRRPEFRLTPIVSSYSPAHSGPLQVDITQVAQAL